MSVVGLNTANPVQSWLVNKVQSALPQNMWSGTPIRNLLQIPVAHAETLGASSQPTPPPSGGSDINNFFQGMGSLLNAANQSTSNGGGGNIPSTATNSNAVLQAGIGQINQGASNGNAQIEADFNQAMSMLSGAESSLQGQASNASSIIDTQAGDTRNQIQNTQTTAENATNASLAQGESQGKTAMQQARDVFNQTQQANNSQLSALGISSSSVTAALAEKLGVETARRIAGVTDSVGQIRQNAVNELGRIKTYYQGQLTTLDKTVQNQKATIQNSLLQGLNQINNARGQAANDKAAARANLLQQTQTSIYNLTAQQQQFQQSLDQWAQQKAAALTPVAQDPNYLNTLISTAQNLNKQFATQGLTFAPSVSYDKLGNITGQISNQKPLIDPATGLPYAQSATDTSTGGPF